MPRLRHEGTGVVVNVDESTAATLGPEWAPVEGSPPATEPKKLAPRHRPSK